MTENEMKELIENEHKQYLEVRDRLEKQIDYNLELGENIGILKTILLDVFKKHGDLCSLCEAKGQKLPECKCMKDNECLKHIIELYGGK